ncbi:hypothetical protein C8J57DRAFT_338629 [Mycena rebaudengoi]|nr:hypothetical protein C8J57DRAFT_338629 [Mycena rebaudengoi]
MRRVSRWLTAYILSPPMSSPMSIMWIGTVGEMSHGDHIPQSKSATQTAIWRKTSLLQTRWESCQTSKEFRCYRCISVRAPLAPSPTILHPPCLATTSALFNSTSAQALGFLLLTTPP